MQHIATITTNLAGNVPFGFPMSVSSAPTSSFFNQAVLLYAMKPNFLCQYFHEHMPDYL